MEKHISRGKMLSTLALSISLGAILGYFYENLPLGVAFGLIGGYIFNKMNRMKPKTIPIKVRDYRK
jgi:hypothetical protein